MDHSTHSSSWLCSVPMAWNWVFCLSSASLAVSPAILCSVNATFVSEIIGTEWKLWTAMVLPTHSVPSLRWQETKPDILYWERTTQTGTWLGSLLKCQVFHREHLTHLAICVSSFYVWGKRDRKNLDIKWQPFMMQLKRVWWLNFTLSWLRRMLTVASQTCEQWKKSWMSTSSFGPLILPKRKYFPNGEQQEPCSSYKLPARTYDVAVCRKSLPDGTTMVGVCKPTGCNRMDE